MRRFKITLSYDGTDFKGWQKQKPGVPTVQGCLEQALQKLFRRPIAVQGAGRTDAGTHARAQVAHFDLHDEEAQKFGLLSEALTRTKKKSASRLNFDGGQFAGDKLLRPLAALTPDSVSVHKLQPVSSAFHALHSCRFKVYKYRVQTGVAPDARWLRQSHYVRGSLDLARLNQYARVLVGRHDFKSFQTQGTVLKSTTRWVYKSYWQKEPFGFFVYTICAQGFLKQMVRNVVGTQLDLLRHNEPVLRMRQILKACDRRCALGTAPAKALCLWRVVHAR